MKIKLSELQGIIREEVMAQENGVVNDSTSTFTTTYSKADLTGDYNYIKNMMERLRNSMGEDSSAINDSSAFTDWKKANGVIIGLIEDLHKINDKIKELNQYTK